MGATRSHPVVEALRRVALHEAPHELWISSRLAAQLDEGENGVGYPDHYERCDVRFRNADGTHTWLELVCAQPYFSHTQPERDHRAHFEQVLFDSAVRDVRERLELVAEKAAPCRTGFALVLGYHVQGRLALPADCIEHFRQRAGLDGEGWTEHHAGAWRNPGIEHIVCLLDVWYWERAFAAARRAGSG